MFSTDWRSCWRFSGFCEGFGAMQQGVNERRLTYSSGSVMRNCNSPWTWKKRARLGQEGGFGSYEWGEVSGSKCKLAGVFEDYTVVNKLHELECEGEVMVNNDYMISVEGVEQPCWKQRKPYVGMSEDWGLPRHSEQNVTSYVTKIFKFCFSVKQSIFRWWWIGLKWLWIYFVILMLTVWVEDSLVF